MITSVDVIFYRGHEPLLSLGRLVRWWTSSTFSHCELHLGRGECFGSAPGIGCRYALRSKAELLLDWAVVPVLLFAGEDEAIRRYCDAEKGAKYDWVGAVFGAGLRLNWQSPSRWQCAEFCASALQEIGLLPGEKPWRLTPAALYDRLAHRVDTCPTP